MKKGKTITKRILEFKYLKFIYIFLIALITLYYSYQKISTLPKWPNEIFSLVCLVMLVLLVSLFSLNSLKISNTKWNIFFIVYISSSLVLIVSSIFATRISEFEGLFFLIPMLFTLLLGTQSGLIFNIHFSLVMFIFTDSNLENFLYFIIFGCFIVFLINYFKSFYKIIIASFVAVLLNFIINVLLQYMVYDEIMYSILLIKIQALLLDIIICCIIALFTNNIITNHVNESKLLKKCNDDFPPIKNLKLNNKEVFNHIKIVEELSIKCAKQINGDLNIVRAGAIYHDIGKHEGKNYVANSIKIAKKYNLPMPVQKIIVEHNGNQGIPSTIESGIVMLVDTFISTIEKINKNNISNISSNQIVNNVLNIRIMNNSLSNSGLTLEHIGVMKKIFIEYLEQEEL